MSVEHLRRKGTSLLLPFLLPPTPARLWHLHWPPLLTLDNRAGHHQGSGPLSPCCLAQGACERQGLAERAAPLAGYPVPSSWQQPEKPGHLEAPSWGSTVGLCRHWQRHQAEWGISTAGALGRANCCLCHLFVSQLCSQPGCQPLPGLGPRASLVARCTNEVWLPWDSHPPPGAADEQAGSAPASPPAFPGLTAAGGMASPLETGLQGATTEAGLWAPPHPPSATLSFLYFCDNPVSTPSSSRSFPTGLQLRMAKQKPCPFLDVHPIRSAVSQLLLRHTPQLCGPPSLVLIKMQVSWPPWT